MKNQGIRRNIYTETPENRTGQFASFRVFGRYIKDMFDYSALINKGSALREGDIAEFDLFDWNVKVIYGKGKFGAYIDLSGNEKEMGQVEKIIMENAGIPA